MSSQLRRAVWVTLCVSLASAGAVALPRNAAAQESTEVKLEEVTVSASRRAGATALQTTPITVTAVTSQDIDRLAAKDISGLAISVPASASLTLSSTRTRRSACRSTTS
jgi:outer membrane cobalamin receptor